MAVVSFSALPIQSHCVTAQLCRDIASRISRLERDDAVGKLEVYRRWFAEEVMKVGQLNTIVVLPVEEISPRYRDEAPS